MGARQGGQNSQSLHGAGKGRGWGNGNPPQSGWKGKGEGSSAAARCARWGCAQELAREVWGMVGTGGAVRRGARCGRCKACERQIWKGHNAKMQETVDGERVPPPMPVTKRRTQCPPRVRPRLNQRTAQRSTVRRPGRQRRTTTLIFDPVPSTRTKPENASRAERAREVWKGISAPRFIMSPRRHVVADAQEQVLPEVHHQRRRQRYRKKR